MKVINMSGLVFSRKEAEERFKSKNAVILREIFIPNDENVEEKKVLYVGTNYRGTCYTLQGVSH